MNPTIYKVQMGSLIIKLEHWHQEYGVIERDYWKSFYTAPTGHEYVGCGYTDVAALQHLIDNIETVRKFKEVADRVFKTQSIKFTTPIVQQYG